MGEYTNNKEINNIKKNFFLNTKSPAFAESLRYCEKVANSNANVLLIGESGTGKEVASQYIHACSPRASNNMVTVNCSAFTETLLESELFGYEQGAFTGALKSKKGKFELAHEGTLFLDEIGDTSLLTQVKLLRVIETKEFERIGSNTPMLIDFRLICATNNDLEENILNNTFREDFFFRISTIAIRIPPLRERKEDLMDMVQFFLKQACVENKCEISYIEPEVNEFLYNYDYPGNIRELKNTIDRLVVLSENGIIRKDDLPILYAIGKHKSGFSTNRFESIVPLKDFRKDTETKYLQWVLDEVNGNVAEASRRLDISTRQLFNKINEYGLQK
ncbi:sigma-54 interaction domain-containing protein [Tissierella pigra]|uniref:Sigma-54-dependent Fis family transcriptional regulator n=1 Tax=Tissierella pigra TaxID=2607614 RepID=A0A6N7XSG0_9FIRM|nr:sigma-54 dependent transcriptional regulator [Tissierella pigra]MSU00697.1 sigma-54-dependent Fis family transcriptional regulator [Tissierella pigra]